MHRYKKGVFKLAAIWYYWLTCIPMYVYASSTSDAVSDIMNNSRFQGAIENIEFLTNLVDYWFTMVITLTAFFIISAAMLKNACAGAYVSNHKFWDKVAEAHEKTEALSIAGIKDYFTGKQFMQTSAGGVRDFLLGLVPNIKAMTDFDDADIEPKQYFTKAIPQMLGCIIIGVFIYNGFYRDAASTVGNFGSEICTRIFCSLDPAAFLDKVTNMSGTPENIYKNDQSQQGKDCYAISMSLYKSYLSVAKELTDIDAKTSLMRSCEAIAKNEVTSNKFFKSTCYSVNRVYDFDLTNLKTTPCPAANGTKLNKLHTEVADKDTRSKYACSMYVSGPAGFDSYLKPEHKCCYITFVMAGSQRKETSVGLSTIEAAVGTWNNIEADPIIADLNISSQGVVNGEVLASGDGNQLVSGDVHVKDILSQDMIETKVKAFCAANDIIYVGSVQVRSFEGYDRGSGKDPIVDFNKEPSGATKVCKINVTFNTQYKVGEKQQTTQSRVTIPVEISLNAR